MIFTGFGFDTHTLDVPKPFEVDDVDVDYDKLTRLEAEQTKQNNPSEQIYGREFLMAMRSHVKVNINIYNNVNCKIN